MQIQQRPDFTARMRHYARAFLLGGPVGVIYALRLARYERQLRQLQQFMDRERDTHRETMRTLNWRMNQLIGRQQATNAAAAQFRRYCDKQAEAAS